MAAGAILATGGVGTSTVKVGPPTLVPFGRGHRHRSGRGSGGDDRLDGGGVDDGEGRLVHAVERHRGGADEPGAGDGDGGAHRVRGWASVPVTVGTAGGGGGGTVTSNVVVLVIEPLAFTTRSACGSGTDAERHGGGDGGAR